PEGQRGLRGRYPLAPNNSASVGVSVKALRCAAAHAILAPSSDLRFASQACLRASSIALLKLGIAIAARMPMIATTIMISMRVNADVDLALVFITILDFFSKSADQHQGFFAL